MPSGPVFTSRLSGRQLLDGEGLAIGRVRDVVILPTAGGEPPWVLGLVVTLQRRQIFVNLGRIAEISVDGAHLKGGAVDLRRFSRRTGEILASELYGQPAGTESVVDVGIVESERRRGGWEVSVLAIGHGRGLGSCGITLRSSSRGTSTRSCSRRARSPSSLSSCGRCTRPISPPRSSTCPPSGDGSWPRRCRTRNWRTCWRNCPSRTRSGCWPGSAWSARPTWWRRWSRTTPRTCSPRCPPSSGSDCWRRWRPCRPRTCAGCCATTRLPARGHHRR
jgi:hypothetical protein